MKFKQISLTFAAAFALWSGCSKETPTAPTADMPSKTPDAVANAQAGVLGKAAEAVKAAEPVQNAETAKLAEAIKGTGTPKTVEATKALGGAKVQELIDKAKSLIGEKKFSDAAGILQQLSGQSLSGAQQALVDGLKEQVQKALSGNAAGAVGNLLKK